MYSFKINECVLQKEEVVYNDRLTLLHYSTRANKRRDNHGEKTDDFDMQGQGKAVSSLPCFDDHLARTVLNYIIAWFSPLSNLKPKYNGIYTNNSLSFATSIFKRITKVLCVRTYVKSVMQNIITLLYSTNYYST